MGLNLLYEYVSLFYHSPVHPLAKLTPHARTHDRTYTHYKVSKTKKMVHRCFNTLESNLSRAHNQRPAAVMCHRVVHAAPSVASAEAAT
jgi:hypothetical protein